MKKNLNNVPTKPGSKKNDKTRNKIEEIKKRREERRAKMQNRVKNKSLILDQRKRDKKTEK